jgi:nucleoside-diphosphate-sugar epimerase
MRVLVLGARGFLGTHVVDALLGAGVEVTAAARSDLAAADTFGALLARVRPAAVVNCAGTTTGDAAQFVAGNVGVPTMVVEALQRTPARLVHLGSAAEYGRGPAGVPVAEDTPERPLGLYGATKLGGTAAVRAARDSGLPAVVLRVFNPIGPGARGDSLAGRAAADIARAAAHGGVLRLGPLDTVRDFVDARDVASAVVSAVTGPLPGRAVLNVGTGRGRRARELVTALVSAAGLNLAIEESSAGSARSTGVPWQTAEVRTIEAELGWRATTAFADSVAAVWSTAVAV